ncbi:MAG TPA: helix-turn-helix domain-containing protein [Pyrinomonadaceae bacterium]|nr:helix-turn-helix domain-containing protein [Pyrinomonadaceae bacterium]
MTLIASINEKGYDRTSLEEVAKRAGMTRGAIYGNFRDKEELFLAVAETRWKPVAPPLKEGATLREQMRILGKTVAAAAEERRAGAVGALSFQLYALTHEEMRARLAQANAEVYRWAERELKKFIPAGELPVPPPQFVRILHALTEGLFTLRFLTPELITEGVIVAAFESLAPRQSSKA